MKAHKCLCCNTYTLFEICSDCQEDNENIIKYIRELQDKLKRRNILVADLRFKNKELKRVIEEFTGKSIFK